MSWDNKVVWNEGMFLRPQHFQQFDRYVDGLVGGRVSALRAYPWGFAQLELDQALLKTGKIALVSASGVTEDGMPFAIPGAADHPRPFEPGAGLKNATLYLALPLRRPGAPDVSLNGDDVQETRFGGREFEAADAVAGAPGRAPLLIGRPRFRILSDEDDLAGYTVLPLARLIERRADDQLVLDGNFIPTMLRCAGSAVLAGLLAEVRGLLHQRAEAIAARLGKADLGSTAAITDFLILQMCNAKEALLNHLESLPDLHPEHLYAVFAELAGEMATFTARNNRPELLPPYRHRDLQASFAPVMDALRQSLSAVFEQDAVAIPLEMRSYGIRVGKIADKNLLKDSLFVLAARAAEDGETLRASLPKRITVGAVERIRDLVNLQLGGAPIRPMPSEPRQIPYRAGMVYFEVNTRHEQWGIVKTSGGVAIHVSGDIPDLVLELWAIRGR